MHEGACTRVHARATEAGVLGDWAHMHVAIMVPA